MNTAALMAFTLVFAQKGGGGNGTNVWVVIGVGLVVGLLQGIILFILKDIRESLKVTVTKEICQLQRSPIRGRLRSLEHRVGIPGTQEPDTLRDGG